MTTQKNFGATLMLKGVDTQKHTVTCVINTDAIDRDREIILPAGLDFSEYANKNGPLLWMHALGDRSAGPERLLGKCIAIGYTANKSAIRATFEFAVEANPVAKQAFDLVAGGFLKAFSIGAMVKRYVHPGSPQSDIDSLPLKAKLALREGRILGVIAESTLVEVSLVFVGSNPEALVTEAADPDRRKILRDLRTGGRALVPVTEQVRVVDLSDFPPAFARRAKELDAYDWPSPLGDCVSEEALALAVVEAAMPALVEALVPHLAERIAILARELFPEDCQ